MAKPAFQISAHVFSFSFLLAPCIAYSAYAYKTGIGDDSPSNKLLRDKYIDGNWNKEHKVKSEAVRAETIKFFKNINHDDEETSKMMNDILKGGAGPGGRENRNRVAIEKTPEKKTVEDRREPLNEGGGGPVSIVKQNKAKTTSEKEREKRVNMRRRLTGQRGGSAASSAAAVEASSTSVSVGVVGTVALGLGLAAGAILQSLKKQ